jgi:proline dehydrogenase
MPVKSPVATESKAKELAVTAGFQKPSVVDTIALPLVLMLAAPYLAGKTAEEAVARGRELFKTSRFTSTIDILGEDAVTEEDCQNFVRQYEHVVDLVAASPLTVSRPQEQITVSLKPSMFSTTCPPDAVGSKRVELDKAFERIKHVTDYARSKNIAITLEAEGHHWTDFHLETYFALIEEGYTNLGTVLQARLFRTKDDIKKFDERMRVRLVIGIYNEPKEIAHTEKSVMKEFLIDYAGDLLRRGTYVELATHDADCLSKFFRQIAIPQHVPGSRFETQFLLGVPRKQLEESLVSGKYFIGLATEASTRDAEYLGELVRTGVPVRMYLPFGADKVAGPYCKRRLKANPNMISYGIKNLLHIQ